MESGRHTAVADPLKAIGDLERIIARIALRSARPRDLTQLRAALGVLPELHHSLDAASSPLLQQLIAELTQRQDSHRADHALLSKAIVDSPPHYLRDGGVIAAGYDAELDELRLLGSNTEQFLLDLERRERERSGLSSLKLGFNRVQGFYIEVSRSQAERVPPDYLRRQTVKSAERFITPELKSFEDKVLGARDRALAREKALYEALLDHLTSRLPALQSTTAAIAEIDVLTCFAERAAALDCAQPELTDEPLLLIDGGRHPVVERAGREPFVPNDLRFDDSRRMLIITGPNMGGKSTYMRQTALIVILAHIGCYVPARRAVLGPMDRIFTRIGASDDLAGGRSTFMLEMTETANILNNATATAWCSWTRWAAAPAPSTACRWPGPAPRSSPTRSAPSRCSPRIISSSPVSPARRREWPTCMSKRWNTARPWCSCTASRKGRPTRAMACRWRPSPAFRNP